MSEQDPASATSCTRKEPRHPVLENNAFVEFEFPAGRRWRLPVLNLSGSGLCFGVDEALAGLAPGTRIPDAVVLLGAERMCGELEVLHVTVGLSTGTTCGSRFSPGGEDDRLRMKAFVDQIERTTPTT